MRLSFMWLMLVSCVYFPGVKKMPNFDYAVLSAVQNELRYFKKLCTDVNEQAVNGVTYTYGKICDKSVVMIASGIGTTCTAAVATNLIKDFDVSALFFLGTAGALDSQQKIGNVIVGSAAFEVEIQGLHDAFMGTPFEPGLMHSIKHEIQKLRYDADRQLLSKVNAIQPEILGEVIFAPLASTNSFNTPMVLIEKSRELGAVAIDMESSALYQVSWLFNKPSLAIRGISNILYSSGDPNQAEVELDIAEKNSALTLKAVIEALSCRKRAQV